MAKEKVTLLFRDHLPCQVHKLSRSPWLAITLEVARIEPTLYWYPLKAFRDHEVPTMIIIMDDNDNEATSLQ